MSPVRTAKDQPAAPVGNSACRPVNAWKKPVPSRIAAAVTTTRGRSGQGSRGSCSTGPPTITTALAVPRPEVGAVQARSRGSMAVLSAPAEVPPGAA